ncbi:MAG: hypothetical protein IJ387_09230, partial [Thermoguttaceae bacterium]|nr:hypothetical protein [Thermoguttaceae bacterium]
MRKIVNAVVRVRSPRDRRSTAAVVKIFRKRSCLPPKNTFILIANVRRRDALRRNAAATPYPAS